MRRGWIVPGGRGEPAWEGSSAQWAGGATQKTSVLAMGLAPSPVPMTSRMHPPAPVAAPP
jgi:hypothetical protein